ncbi:ATP-binding protein [Streptomyces aidingensis]|uniref:histidine kinase n=1 Tax=Streptomyces aidingensis TaxID=910347 RepID=A0A1I1FQT9_9ACTN|nr:ATP-binding protein [Streptomyces aidingensis]SFC01807.1 hypothetical protein SAMN05421773_101837 [Streptomyces aidingensis]
MTRHLPDAVFWLLAAGLLTAVVLWMRQRRVTAVVRSRCDRLADGIRSRDDEIRHLAAVRLPAMEESLHRPAEVPGPLDELLARTDFGKGLQVVAERFADAAADARARAERSAKAALKTSMRSIQALANEQQMFISEMQERHDDPAVLHDLLAIDHANAQFSRRAQAIAVLCGSWPGRQRAAAPLDEVIRGATSRIRDYRRIRIAGQVDLAVVSRAVEPVVLAVAELLDNAARHSQPHTSVEVSLQGVHNGACVVVDDAGVGMDSQVARRAAALLTGRRGVDVTRLDDPPQFGFPVVGVLAARYGFSVSVDTQSPYGGVRAVVFLPSALLTQVTEEPPPGPADEGGERDGRPSASAAGDGAGPPEPTTAGGLPRRRRRARADEPPADPAGFPGEPEAADAAEAAEAAQPAGPAGRAADTADDRAARDAARRMGAFARGTRTGRDGEDPRPDAPRPPDRGAHHDQAPGDERKGRG